MLVLRQAPMRMPMAMPVRVTMPVRALMPVAMRVLVGVPITVLVIVPLNVALVAVVSMTPVARLVAIMDMPLICSAGHDAAMVLAGRGAGGIVVCQGWRGCGRQ